MSSAADFDRFYVDTRDRMLAESETLAGDRASARRAVCDGYVALWHHWRAASRSGDLEEWLRSRVRGGSRPRRRHQRPRPGRDDDWPEASVLRRRGAARRRSHALVATGAAVAALVVSGVVVGGSGDAVPTALADEDTGGLAVARPAAEEEPPATLGEAVLLAPSQVERLAPGLRWRETRTDDNLRGNGLVAPCQAERFADPEGLAGVVRRFEGSRRRGPASHAAEMVELSRSPRIARRAFDTAVGWYAGCAEPRVQLVDTRQVAGVGDEAVLLVLRDWGATPTRRVAVGVARTGSVLVTTSAELASGRLRTRDAATALAAGINRLCGSDGAGTCAAPPRDTAIPPFTTGEAPGMLAEVDLPPVARADGPWVGTAPEVPRVNAASTRCDNTSFVGSGLSRNRTRTFLFPANRAATSFGLTQSVARTATAARARAFVRQVRKRITACGRADLGTEVRTLDDVSDGAQDRTVWALTIELGGNRTLEFWMAVLRRGSAVSQVGYVSESALAMSLPDFRATTGRALARLSDLPDARPTGKRAPRGKPGPRSGRR